MDQKLLFSISCVLFLPTKIQKSKYSLIFLAKYLQLEIIDLLILCYQSFFPLV